MHAADYRGPAPFAGQRVVVVGAGNSAVQIAAELARDSGTTLATRAPVKFARQHLLGRDLHFWLTRTGLDAAPLGRLLRTPPAQPVLDGGPLPCSPHHRHPRPAPDVHRPRRRPGHLGGRHHGAVGHADPRHRLPPAPALPRRSRRCPRSRRVPPPPRRRLLRPSGSGVRWAGVAAQSVLEHAARGRPGRPGGPPPGLPPGPQLTPCSLGSMCVNIDVCRM
ncbi:hypothetical protein [Streptomyces chengmaiensis]|uniref:hypothetical protein n=1 Tax=Streptomyces chengmaiensis TaxID=3040919 RepID=UPI0029621CB1|nr:hypothetical protein [Streptomyces chengmaiensis]